MYLLIHLNRLAPDGKKNNRPVDIDLHIQLGEEHYTFLMCVLLDDETKGNDTSHFRTVFRARPERWVVFDDEAINLNDFDDTNFGSLLRNSAYLALFIADREQNQQQ